MIARRSFLASLLAAGASPAIVKAASIMPVRPSGIVAPVPFVVGTQTLLNPQHAMAGDTFHVHGRLRIYGGAQGAGHLLAELSLPTEWLTQCVVDRTGIIVGTRYLSDGTAEPIWQ